jgi:hypothetical protein
MVASVFSTEQLFALRLWWQTDFYHGHITVGHHDSVLHWWPNDFGGLIGSYPCCNLSALVKCTIGGKELLQDPQLPPSVPAGYVASLRKKLFHYKGLFPFGHWGAEFITLCVFKFLQLIQCRLSTSELLEVFDILVSGIWKWSFQHLLPTFQVPVKVLYVVVSNYLMNSLGFTVGC